MANRSGAARPRRAQRLALDWLTFDEGYGGKPDFLRVLDAAGRTCVGEGPRTFSGRPGRRRTALGAEAVFAQAGVRRRAARSFRFPQQTGPQAVGQAQGVDVALGHDRRPRQRWILVRNRETGERKDFLTNAPRRIGVRRVLAAGFVRGNVEHVFRVAKGEVGLTHVAGQSCVSLKRPLALRLVVLAFVSLHTKRLRGEKRGGDPGAGGRRPWPWSAGGMCAGAGGRLRRRAYWTCSSTINAETPRRDGRARNGPESSDASLRYSVKEYARNDSCTRIPRALSRAESVVVASRIC